MATCRLSVWVTMSGNRVSSGMLLVSIMWSLPLSQEEEVKIPQHLIKTKLILRSPSLCVNTFIPNHIFSNFQRTTSPKFFHLAFLVPPTPSKSGMSNFREMRHWERVNKAPVLELERSCIRSNPSIVICLWVVCVGERKWRRETGWNQTGWLSKKSALLLPLKGYSRSFFTTNLANDLFHRLTLPLSTTALQNGQIIYLEFAFYQLRSPWRRPNC